VNQRRSIGDMPTVAAASYSLNSFCFAMARNGPYSAKLPALGP
jgi:hypothetical protein